MPKVDDLSIEIQASATQAVGGINNLITRLNDLNSAMSNIRSTGLSQFASSMTAMARSIQNMKDLNVKTQDFTRIARNINALNGIDVTNLPTVAANIQTLTTALNSTAGITESSSNVATMASAISRFGYASTQRAIANIPQLTRQLMAMFTELSKAPEISNNVVRLAEALSRLQRGTVNVSTSTNTATRSLNGFNLSAINARRATLNLAATFGRFYANCFLLLRGIRAVSKAITGSMDYVETYNYFSVTMKKIGNQFGRDYEKFSKGFDEAGNKLGYSSAEEYANSFSSRLNELTKKMTGFEVGQNGELLSSTDMSLGLDPEKVMNFQASISAITNSVGMLGEESVNTSKALTMLAADFSSLKNIDLETTMQNLQSGLIGQSRALYKYGVDITQATLAQYALAHGVKKKVSEMTQSEKMELRLLAILDQSKIAYGDQANTLNSVANQYRIFKQQITNLGRVLGNLFLPVVKQLLPMINGLTIALRELLETFGLQLFGESWLSDIMDGISQGPGEISEEIADNLDDANESATKLKKQLQGFDELNVLNSSDTNGTSGLLDGGLGLSDDIADALAEYERIWEEALSNTRNIAQEYAQKITQALQPIKNWFYDFIADAKAGRWFALGRDISDAIIGGFDLGSRLLDNVNWEDIGKKIGKFLKGIKWKQIFASGVNFFDKLVNAAISVWASSFNTAKFETAMATGLALCTFTGCGQIVARSLLASISAAIIGYEVGKKLGELIDKDLYSNFHWSGEGGFFEEVTNFDSIGEAITTNLYALVQLLEDLNIVQKIYDAIWFGLTGGDTSHFGFKWFGEGGFFNEVFGGYDSIGDWAEIQVGVIREAFNDINSYIVEKTLLITDAINSLFETFKLHGFTSIYEQFIRPLLASEDIGEWFKEFIKDFDYNLVYMRNALISGLNNMITCVESFINLLLDGYSPLLQVMSLVGEAVGFNIPTSIHLGRVKHFENGGYPTRGDLFWANEGGTPELVGTVGGKTAVGSGAEITGISTAVYETGAEQASLLNTCVSLLQIISEKEFGITDNDIARSVVRSNRESINRTGKALV